MDNEIINKYQAIVDSYQQNQSIKQIADKLGVSVTKVRRVLITEGLWSSRSSRKVGELLKQGLSTANIAEVLGITDKAVESYLPYSKGAYGDSRSNSAIRSESYRERNASVAERQVNTPEDRDMVIERNEVIRDAAVQRENANQDRDVRAMLLRLELDTAMLPPKQRAILKRYGRADNGISRDIIVPANISLHSLHYAIQRVFGWQNSHLHNFKLPDGVFKALVGKEEKFKDWMPLCGLYFRFPTDDMQDLYWDDDYDGDISVKTWMRRKYTAPYYYGGFSEHYIESQLSMLAFCRDNPEIVVSPTFEEWQKNRNEQPDVKKQGKQLVTVNQLTVREFNRTVEASLEELLERLTVGELLYPEGTKLSDAQISAVKQKADEQIAMFRDKATTVQQYHRRIIDASEFAKKHGDQGLYMYDSEMIAYEHFINQTETEVVPVTDSLVYEYDYGDGWKVKITCKEIYPVEIGEDDPIMEGYKIIPMTEEQVFNDVRVFDRLGHKLEGSLRDQVARVISKMRPLCIAADGLNVMDDVGGVGGYCDFLSTIHESDDGEAEEMRDWARGMGWTGRKNQPENML